MRTKRILIALAVGAVVGWTLFGVMVARVTTVEKLGDEQARRRFERVRDHFEDPTPRLSVVEGGEMSWQPLPQEDVAAIETLSVMAYRGPVHGLVQVDVPMWFLRLKEPAVRFALRETGVELSELGLTSKRLRSYGPAILLDERRPNGDQVLIWTQGEDDADRPPPPPSGPGSSVR